MGQSNSSGDRKRLDQRRTEINNLVRTTATTLYNTTNQVQPTPRPRTSLVYPQTSGTSGTQSLATVRPKLNVAPLPSAGSISNTGINSSLVTTPTELSHPPVVTNQVKRAKLHVARLPSAGSISNTGINSSSVTTPTELSHPPIVTNQVPPNRPSRFGGTGARTNAGIGPEPSKSTVSPIKAATNAVNFKFRRQQKQTNPAMSNINLFAENLNVDLAENSNRSRPGGVRGRGGPRNHSANRYNNSNNSNENLVEIRSSEYVNRGHRGGRGRGGWQSNQKRNNWNQNYDNRDGTNPNSNRPRGGFFGFKKLEELLQKNPEETLVVLINNKEKLTNYLKGNDLSPDIMVLVIEVLSHVINSTFIDSVAQLLLTIVGIDFFEPVRNYILQLPLEDSAKKNRGRRFWNAPDQFFLNVSLTLEALIEILPSTAMDIVPETLEAIQYTLPNIEQRHHLSFRDEVTATFADLELKMSQLMTKEEEKKRKRREEPDEEEPPPNDFRDIAVYPTALEITTRVNTYLRKNVIKGAYKDVYHYLDVQYRLLREDFVAPLRDGICEYFERTKDGPRGKLSSIKIHKSVLCLGVVANKQQVGYLVQAVKAGSIKNLDNSRRFMFGSLVCLTSDNFTTIIFGKIIDRDRKFLSEGRLVLGFDAGVELEINTSYILVECTIYFEPYYQVLTALKQMDERRFPLKEYLVDVKTECELPDYLDSDNIDHLVPHLSALNGSQMQAFAAAMTKKFCIIQGPPGTGKTYLGLKVAHHLLNQKEIWKSAPMLVICYTNHALDQFLEGLLPKTTSLVRVGGQSKNETLNQYNLRNIRVKRIPGAYFETQREKQWELDRTARELGTHGAILTMINEFSYVLKFDTFYAFEVDPEFENSWFSKATPDQLLKWLLYQPENRNQVQFADYEAINQLIQNLTLQKMQEQEEGEENEENEGNNENEDNPMNAQINQHRIDLEDDDIAPIDYTQTDGRYLLSIPKLHDEIINFTKFLRQMQASGLENTMEYLHNTQKLIKMRIDFDYVCQQMRMLRNVKDFPGTYVDYENPNHMLADDRWLLYGYWVNRVKDQVMLKYIETDREYRRIYSEFNEIRDMVDLYKLKDVDVVGMTTTGAARLHKTIQALKCPIVIVEEAAEVLEAHIITALSPQCQHLILIGDHKQLKPSTADFKITKDYKLGVSLFERMVENGLHCHTLNVQHRMRPEIANLVCPSIYPDLENHESVYAYPQIRGIDSPLYFITHNHRETESHDRSKENHYEAEYLILLARHLVLNNYDASRITIIAAYSGQWFVMRRLKQKYHILKDMRICILDNFQGEENDIILLSLVRNNDEQKNGFLDLENRICVALSRAKHGMYIMGNILQLCNKSKIWPLVGEVLMKYDAIGEYLTVRCTNHQETVTHLREIDDFKKVPEGGCLKVCAKPLACGHTCSKLCHSTNHENYKCHQPCTKILCQFNHICPDKCYEDCKPCMVPKPCTLRCGHSMDIPCHKTPDEIHCPELVRTKLPCGHETDKPCHEDAEKFACPHPCESRVEPCGHSCRMRCHIRSDPNHETYKCFKQCVKSNENCSMPDEFKHPCQKQCFEICMLCGIEVKKVRSCGHYFDVPCHGDVEEVVCKKPCKIKLPCGHGCVNKCNDICGPCKIKVSKEIVKCGHSILWECAKEPLKTNCNSKVCSSILPCGHKCTLPCRKECGLCQCMELVPFNLPSPCGHQLMVPCHLKNITKITNDLLSYCTEKCPVNLKCGHDCPGTCGQCAQGRFHISCNEKCSKILICGHECATPCVEACKPCIQACYYRCEHSKCTKQCGAPCTNCKEPCNRRCSHQFCAGKCGDPCTVPPCTEPCNKILDCMHPCIGFCGDECPPLCRICNKEQVTEVFLGHEDEEDARFVVLPQCKHVLENQGLEGWFGTNAGGKEIKVLTCPLCKTPVNTLRYRDHIKQAYLDVQRVKAQYFGDPAELKELTKALKSRIAALNQYTRLAECHPVLVFFANCLKTTSKNKRQDHSKIKLVALRAKLDIAVQLIRMRYKSTMDGTALMLNKQAQDLANDYLSFLFSKLIADSFIANEQQVEEFQMEILRFNRVMQLVLVLNRNPMSETHREYGVCYNKLFSFKKYNSTHDALIKHDLEALIKVAANGLAVTDAERKTIVAAIGLNPGHWFKCANGHMYVIGECGGAMEEAKCPECNLRIGGSHHQLLPGNRLAPEMAGAREPAYPTLNNIDLYQL